MTQKEYDLSHYRIAQAEETFRGSVVCFNNGLFKDSEPFLLCSFLCGKSCTGFGFSRF